jgi:hypothetical protein
VIAEAYGSGSAHAEKVKGVLAPIYAVLEEQGG